MQDVTEQPREPTLWERFPGMRPVHQLPTLYRVLGTGTAMSGWWASDPATQSYVASHVFTILFVPVWAFGAYRVQPSSRGGYLFLGRLPLGAFSVAFNAVVMLLALLGLSYGTWWGLVGAAEAYARDQMGRVESLVEDGRLTEAGELLYKLMQSRRAVAGKARGRLAELLKEATATPKAKDKAPIKPLGTPKEVAGLLAVGTRLEADGDPLLPDLFQRGYEYADHLGEKDPEGAFAVLDSVVVLSGSNWLAGLDNFEMGLLERVVKRAPRDVDHVSRLAVVYARKGQLEKARPLLEPLREKLGQRPGAAVLGRIYLQEERYEEARALLRPVVDARAGAYTALVQKRDKESSDAYQTLLREIRDGTARGFNYAEYNKASPARQEQMQSEYYGMRLPDLHRARVAYRAVERESLTPDAIQALGQAEAHLAQKLETPEDRQRALVAAENTFRLLQPGGLRTQDDYLRMARAYYWLGKPAEGRKLLDALLTRSSGRPDRVESVARVLRSVGAFADARKVLEEAHEREKDAQARLGLAFYRSLCSVDLDDRLAWLEKSAKEQPEVRVSLLQARGLKARELGQDDEAKKFCREALDLYKGMQENGATLNNSALVYFDLYDLDHDPNDFREGVRRMEAALKDYPTSEIILRNVASSLMGVVGEDAAGGAIDYSKLRVRPGTYYLPYLYDDEAGRRRLLSLVRKHPALARVRGHLGRLLLLAPRRADVFSLLFRLHEQLGERDKLASLHERLERTEVDTSDTVRETREHYEGKKDAKNRVEQRHVIARARKALQASRELGWATHAAAAARLSQLLMQMNVYEKADADEVVALAEEGHQAYPSESTGNLLVVALLFRAQQRLRATDAGFAALCKKSERSLGTFLVNWVLARGGPARAKLLADEDIRRAQRIRLTQLRRFPEGRGVSDWSLLVASHPKEAAAIARRIRERKSDGIAAAIDLRLSPLSGSATVVRAMVLEVEGKGDEARRLVASKAAEGVPLPGGW